MKCFSRDTDEYYRNCVFWRSDELVNDNDHGNVIILYVFKIE